MSTRVLAVRFRKIGVAFAALLLAGVTGASRVDAQASPELSSLDMWIIQRYKGAQLLPDSGARSGATVAQAGAPRVESTRSTARRDTLVALHFGNAMWRPTLGTNGTVMLADPTGAVTNIAGKITARRPFRAPKKAGARESEKDDWRIGWAYLVAIPARAANASTSGFGGWAIAETTPKVVTKPSRATPSNSAKESQQNSAERPGVMTPPPAVLPPVR